MKHTAVVIESDIVILGDEGSISLTTRGACRECGRTDNLTLWVRSTLQGVALFFYCEEHGMNGVVPAGLMDAGLHVSARVSEVTAA